MLPRSARQTVGAHVCANVWMYLSKWAPDSDSQTVQGVGE